MIQVWEQDLLLLLTKVFFIVISLIYTVFAFMMLRQVALMNKSFTASLHTFFTFLSWVHFLAAILGVALVFIIL